MATIFNIAFGTFAVIMSVFFAIFAITVITLISLYLVGVLMIWWSDRSIEKEHKKANKQLKAGDKHD